ncbi:ubiquinol-cytochrome C chaperone family protein [Nostoc sp. NIES-2111]
MIFGLFRGRDRNLAIVDGLYAAVAEASRNPALYRDLGVPDTIDGRFDSLVLHAFLVMRRLRELPAPADELAQDLVNAIFPSSMRRCGNSGWGISRCPSA